MESFKEISKSNGYRLLKQTVIAACEKRCFNTMGCTVKIADACYARPCNKFKWVIDRAKHYSHKTGVPVSKLLTAWEEQRNYWYQNYYQDANQPKLNRADVLVVEGKDELQELFKKGFRCPACNGISRNPITCTSEIKIKGKTCNWKAYGLLGTLGKGLYVFPKDIAIGTEIFMPIVLEEKGSSE